MTFGLVLGTVYLTTDTHKSPALSLFEAKLISGRAISLVVPSDWGKQDYINDIWACFGQGDSFAGSENFESYNTAWDTTVNNCLWSTFGIPGQGSAQGVPVGWGKQDYINYYTKCFGEGDSTAAGSADYHDTWDNTVNTCLAGYFTGASGLVSLR